MGGLLQASCSKGFPALVFDSSMHRQEELAALLDGHCPAPASAHPCLIGPT